MLSIIRSLLGRSWVVALSAAGLVGCSVHPIPYDVTRVSTADIVEKIRCEAREGLQKLVRDHPKHPILKHTAIGFDFKFDITEDNNLSLGNLKYHRKGFLPDKLTKWDMAGEGKRKRKNVRQFLTVDTLEKLNEAQCSETGHRRNWIYPIVGSIGMREVVETYLRLEEITDLEGEPQLPKKKEDAIVFSDALEYTTTFGGSVTPTLELATVAGKFKLTNATIMGEAQRIDMHNVTVALAQDGDGPVDLLLSTSRFREDLRGSRRKERAGAELARQSRGPAGINAFQSPAGARAVDAAIVRGLPAKDRVLAELVRRRQLNEEERIAERLLQILRPDP